MLAKPMFELRPARVDYLQHIFRPGCIADDRCAYGPSSRRCPGSARAASAARSVGITSIWPGIEKSRAAMHDKDAIAMCAAGVIWLACCLGYAIVTILNLRRKVLP